MQRLPAVDLWAVRLVNSDPIVSVVEWHKDRVPKKDFYTFSFCISQPDCVLCNEACGLCLVSVGHVGITSAPRIGLGNCLQEERYWASKQGLFCACLLAHTIFFQVEQLDISRSLWCWWLFPQFVCMIRLYLTLSAQQSNWGENISAEGKKLSFLASLATEEWSWFLSCSNCTWASNGSCELGENWCGHRGLVAKHIEASVRASAGCRKTLLGLGQSWNKPGAKCLLKNAKLNILSYQIEARGFGKSLDCPHM